MLVNKLSILFGKFIVSQVGIRMNVLGAGDDDLYAHRTDYTLETEHP